MLKNPNKTQSSAIAQIVSVSPGLISALATSLRRKHPQVIYLNVLGSNRRFRCSTLSVSAGSSSLEVCLLSSLAVVGPDQCQSFLCHDHQTGLLRKWKTNVSEMMTLTPTDQCVYYPCCLTSFRLIHFEVKSDSGYFQGITRWYFHHL